MADLRVGFDVPVDVLHINYRECEDYEGDGLPKGVELDFSTSDDSACGAKVIGFDRNGWRANIDDLALIIAHHLDIDPSKVREAILKAVNG